MMSTEYIKKIIFQTSRRLIMENRLELLGMQTPMFIFVLKHVNKTTLVTWEMKSKNCYIPLQYISYRTINELSTETNSYEILISWLEYFSLK